MRMIEPPIDVLEKKVGNRYALSVLTAKRAKQLSQGQKPLVPVTDEKIVSIAALEIFEDKIKPKFEDEN